MQVCDFPQQKLYDNNNSRWLIECRDIEKEEETVGKVQNKVICADEKNGTLSLDLNIETASERQTTKGFLCLMGWFDKGGGGAV